MQRLSGSQACFGGFHGLLGILKGKTGKVHIFVKGIMGILKGFMELLRDEDSHGSIQTLKPEPSNHKTRQSPNSAVDRRLEASCSRLYRKSQSRKGP